MHVLTLVERGKTPAAKRGRGLRITLRHLQRLRGKPRACKRSQGAQPQGADIFTEQLGGHFH